MSRPWNKRGRMRIAGHLNHPWVQFDIITWDAKQRTMVIAAEKLPVHTGVNRLRLDTGGEALVIHQQKTGFWIEPQTGSRYEVESLKGE